MSKSLLSVLLLFFVVLLLVSPADANLGGGSNKKRRRKKKKRRRRRKKADSSSSSAFNHGKINRRYEDLTAYELLEYLTDTSGPKKGFSILLQLIDAADIQDEVDGLLQDFTLFAPNDQAFCRTATNDLGYDGSCDADDVLDWYVDVLGDLVGDDDEVLGDTLVKILTYHAAGGRMTVEDLRRKGHFTTICGCFDIEVKKISKRKTKLYDATKKYPNIEFRQQNMAVADDGMVHVIKGVLLPPLNNCPPGGGNDCLFAPSVAFVCGEYDCKYNSVCDFQAAGFKRSECSRVDDEYQCGSDCITDRQCESGVQGDVGGCPVCRSGKCRAIGPGGEYQCGSDCSTDQQCRSGVQGQVGGCPYCVDGKCDPRPAGRHPDEFPCGFECLFDEQCANRVNADGACPYCTDRVCSWSRESAKLKCGSTCESDQQCEAGAQGDDNGCPVCTDGVCTVIEPSCPIAVGGTCTNEEKPVVCGDLFCRYNNQCFADLAGFTAADCNRVGIAECGAFCVSGKDCLSAEDILNGCEFCINNECSSP